MGTSHAFLEQSRELAVVAQAPVWERLGRSRVAFRHRGAAPLRRRWPLLANSRQRAERFPADSLPLRVALPCFALGVAAGGVSRGHSGRCARGGSIERLLSRAVLYEVEEHGADGGGFFEPGHDP